MMNNLEVAQILRDAVRVIERKGWCQNELESTEGRVCMMGAVLEAAHIMNSYSLPEDSAYELAGVAIRTLNINCGNLVSRYNDVFGRTEEEVKKFMLSVADKIEVEND